MTKLSTIINGIHLPTAWVMFLLAVIGQFTLLQNGKPVDLTTNEGIGNAVVLILLLLVRTIQPSKV